MSAWSYFILLHIWLPLYFSKDAGWFWTLFWTVTELTLSGNCSQQHPLRLFKLSSTGIIRWLPSIRAGTAPTPPEMTTSLRTTALPSLRSTKSLTSCSQSWPCSVVLIFSTQRQYFFLVLDELVMNGVKQQWITRLLQIGYGLGHGPGPAEALPQLFRGVAVQWQAQSPSSMLDAFSLRHQELLPAWEQESRTQKR